MILAYHLTRTRRTTSLKYREMKASTISKGLTLAGGYFFSQMLKYMYAQAPRFGHATTSSRHAFSHVHEAGPST